MMYVHGTGMNDVGWRLGCPKTDSRGDSGLSSQVHLLDFLFQMTSEFLEIMFQRRPHHTFFFSVERFHASGSQ